jgi:hypothetical protein
MPQDNKRVIRIESILGGNSPTSHFSAPDQFLKSNGIDPSRDVGDIGFSSGAVRPVGSTKFSGTKISNAPLWIVGQPKTGSTFVYGSDGSAYTLNDTFTAPVEQLEDGGSLASSSGNGCAYYDNYIYFAKNTDIARFGPLNGTPAFNGTYWTGTLSKTALVNTTYPADNITNITLPNHFLHRHSDGRLYIADVVGNQGTIHFIQTTKVTVEGDTDQGSTYSKLSVGYGLWPTAIESYGSDLAVAFYEGSSANVDQQRAKLAFWDTTSTSVNKITWVEFPDCIITGLKNVNGVLYVVSGSVLKKGFRITRFLGGYTFEEVHYSEYGSTPMPGAIDGITKRIIFGGQEDANFAPIPSTGLVFSYGLQKSSLGQGLFGIIPVNDSSDSGITSLRLVHGSDGLEAQQPIIGWSTGNSGSSSNGLSIPSSNFSINNSGWWSQIYKIGQPFKITKIRIPLEANVSSTTTIVIKVYTDSVAGTTYTLQTINNTNYSGKRNVVFRSDSSGNPILGQNNFFIEAIWSGTVVNSIILPITIEYELLDD